MAVLQWHKIYKLGEYEFQIAPVVALNESWVFKNP